MGVVTWTNRDAATVKKMAAEGRTPREISVVIGKTRNAVIGFAHRNKIKLKPKPQRKEDSMTTVKTRENKRLSFIDLMPQRNMTAPAYVTLLQAKDHHCRFILSHEPKDMIICAQPIMVDSYCLRHWQLTRQEKKHAEA